MSRIVGTVFYTTGTINFITEMTPAEVEAELFGVYPDVPESTSLAHLVCLDEAHRPLTIIFVRGHIQGLAFKDEPMVKTAGPTKILRGPGPS